MKIIITFSEALDKYDWLKICDLKGINEWCINEGLADDIDTIEFTEEEATQLGIINRKITC